eukprot:scaffold6634_cov158-Amphora_coffeaeformis.AAC.23
MKETGRSVFVAAFLEESSSSVNVLAAVLAAAVWITPYVFAVGVKMPTVFVTDRRYYFVSRGTFYSPNYSLIIYNITTIDLNVTCGSFSSIAHKGKTRLQVKCRKEDRGPRSKVSRNGELRNVDPVMWYMLIWRAKHKTWMGSQPSSKQRAMTRCEDDILLHFCCVNVNEGRNERTSTIMHHSNQKWIAQVASSRFTKKRGKEWNDRTKGGA